MNLRVGSSLFAIIIVVVALFFFGKSLFFGTVLENSPRSSTSHRELSRLPEVENAREISPSTNISPRKEQVSDYDSLVAYVDQLDSADLDAPHKLALIGSAVRLASSGGGLEFTLEFIFEKCGAGSDLELLLARAMLGARSGSNANEILALAGNYITDESSKSVVHSFSYGLLGRSIKEWPQGENLSKLSDIQIKILEPALVNSLGGSFDESGYADAFNYFVELNTKFPEAISGPERLFSAISGISNPEGVWNVWKTTGENFDDPRFSKVLFRKLAKRSPQQMLELAEGDSSVSQLSRLNAVNSWFAKNPKEVEKWAASANFLDQSTEQAFFASSAFFSGKQGDLTKMRELATKINDPELKKWVGSKIWNVENRAVAQVSEKDPQRTVVDIANGVLEYKPVYLPTALNAWIKQDAEAAAQWVEQEGVNLPPETRQFVAITYAKEAVSQGDVGLAEQWADLIVDQDRKDRVMKIINSRR